MTSLQRLFESTRIDSVHLKNRIVMLPMVPGGARDYRITDDVVEFYRRVAKGGTGLIIVGSCMVSDLTGTSPSYDSTPRCPGIFSDDLIPGLERLTTTVHELGGKISAQLEIHYEWRANKETALESVGASDVPSGPRIPPSRALTIDEIQQIVKEYGEAARRAREAGFDMVEIHSGIGYLLNRFLSSYSNKRTDHYGGTLENRMRLLLEVIASVRNKAGSDYPYTCRISADEFMEGGNILEDTRRIAVSLEETGVAAISVQAGWHESPRPLTQRWVPPGAFVYLAHEVKKVVGIPIIAGYRIADPFLAESIVASGKADFVGMARALIADPEFPNKAREGRFDDICYCTCCCRCLDDILEGKPIACSVNAEVGRPEAKPALVKKKVLVIGAGPSGMEAARVATLRGHQVTLCDTNPRLGGLILMASVVNSELEKWAEYLKRQVQKLPIEVRLRTRATATLLKELKPDVVVLAGGGVYPDLEIPSINSKNVISGHDISEMVNGRSARRGLLWQLARLFLLYFYSPGFVRWAMRLNFPIRKRVVIIGGGFAGCELAEVLAEKGKQVTILEKSARIGSDIGINERWVVRRRLRELKVGLETNVTSMEITHKGVKFSQKDLVKFVNAGTVLLAEKLVSNHKLVAQFEWKAPAVYVVGDCAEPGWTREAVASGFRIGSEV